MNSEFDVEKIIERIVMSDEMEINEYDFDECFTALREMSYEIDRLKKQVEQLQLELIQALSDSENNGFGEK